MEVQEENLEEEKEEVKTEEDNNTYIIRNWKLQNDRNSDESESSSEESKDETDIRPQSKFFQLIGGEKTLATIIPLFYEKVLRTNNLKGYFKGIDMTKQIYKYQSFLSVILGSRKKWDGRTIRQIHAPYRCSEKDYIDFMQNFKNSLLEVNISEDIANELVEFVNLNFKDEVLN